MAAKDIYLDGWLQFKEKKFESYWFVLKAIYENGAQKGAELQCYNDRPANPKNFHGSIYLNFENRDSMECIKIEGKKSNDFRFSIMLRCIDARRKCWDKLEDKELNFCAYDSITRERWLYALCDVAGNQLPPTDQLPTEQNSIIATRPKAKSPFSFKKQMNDDSNAFTEYVAYTNMARRGSEFLLPNARSPPPPPRIQTTTLQTPIPTPIPASVRDPTARRRSDFVVGYNDLMGRPAQHIPRSKSPARSVSPSRPISQGGMVSHGSRPVASGNVSASSPGEDALLKCDWYHGKIPRDKCEQILRSNISGAFMLRASASQANSFSCSFKNGKGLIFHLIISPTNNGMYKISDKTSNGFHSPIDATLYYMQKQSTPEFQPFPIGRSKSRNKEKILFLPEATLNKSFDQQRLMKQMHQSRGTGERGPEKRLSQSQGELHARMEHVAIAEDNREAASDLYITDRDDAEPIRGKMERTDSEDGCGYLKLSALEKKKDISAIIEERYDNRQGLRRQISLKEANKHVSSEEKIEPQYGDIDNDDPGYLKLDDDPDYVVVEDDNEYQKIKAPEPPQENLENEYMTMESANTKGPSLPRKPIFPPKAVGQPITLYLDLEATDDKPSSMSRGGDNNNGDVRYINKGSSQHVGDNDNDNTYETMNRSQNNTDKFQDDGDDSYVTMRAGQPKNGKDNDSAHVTMNRSPNNTDKFQDDGDDSYVTMKAGEPKIGNDDDSTYVTMNINPHNTDKFQDGGDDNYMAMSAGKLKSANIIDDDPDERYVTMKSCQNVQG